MTDPESESSHLGSMEAELTGLADGLDGERKAATPLVQSSAHGNLSLGSLNLGPEVVGQGPFWTRPGHQGVN